MFIDILPEFLFSERCTIIDRITIDQIFGEYWTNSVHNSLNSINKFGENSPKIKNNILIGTFLYLHNLT